MRIKFYFDKLLLNDFQDAFIVFFDEDVDNKREFLEVLYKKLQLPDYFGFNWDALEECMNDFHWITENNIILIHEKLPKLESHDLKIYLEILSDSKIQVYINTKYKDFLKALQKEDVEMENIRFRKELKRIRKEYYQLAKNLSKR